MKYQPPDGPVQELLTAAVAGPLEPTLIPLFNDIVPFFGQPFFCLNGPSIDIAAHW